ncbi:hypothetical protein J4401_06825 [Candidatus Woesearchaeota archaeon]|nr:hypothetical protein [Candidatus Woesearchaeota archaeon]
MKNVLMATKVNDSAFEGFSKELTGVDVKVDRLRSGLKELDGLKDGELEQRLVNYNVLVVRSDKVDKRIMDASRSLELVIRAGAAVSDIDVNYATQMGVIVSNTPGRNSNAVSELVFSFMLDAYRHAREAHLRMVKGEFPKADFVGRELRGKRIGILGYGNIGQLVAEKSAAFGMKIVAYDPLVGNELFGRYGTVRATTIDECFNADIVTLHMPLTEGTKGAIGLDQLKNMNTNGLLINTARAGLIDEDTLIGFMWERTDVRYAADVHYGGDKEGLKKVLERFPSRVLATPHIGGNTYEANSNAFIAAAMQLRSFVEKGIAQNAVNYNPLSEAGRPYADAARLIASFASHLFTGNVSGANITYRGYVPDMDAVTGYALAAILGGGDVNPVNARSRFDSRKLNLTVTCESPDDTRRDIEVTINDGDENVSVSGALFDNMIRITGINGYQTDYGPVGSHLVVHHRNEVGAIGKIGTAIGDVGINIAYVKNVSRGGNALTLVTTDRTVEGGVIDKITGELDPHYIRQFRVD